MKPKYLTVFLLIIFSSTACTRQDTRSPQSIETPAKPTIMIVHGAFGGSWEFRDVDFLLREQGYSVYRPSLTGLGERIHLATPEVSLSTHIEDVVNMLLYEDLHDVVLVGHSYGGMVITGVANRVPERIRHLIYLDAALPNYNESLMTLASFDGEEFEQWLEQRIQGDFIVPDWVKPEQPLPKDGPQPLKTFTESIVLKNITAQQISGTYILTVEKGQAPRNDDFVLSAERAKERGWKVFELEADHYPQRSAPEELIEMLSKIIEDP